MMYAVHIVFCSSYIYYHNSVTQSEIPVEDSDDPPENARSNVSQRV